MSKRITLKLMLFLYCSCFAVNITAQGFNEDKTAFSNFLHRMYNSAPFEGVKVVDDYDHKYLISVLSLEKAKYTNQSTIMRVAQVKAQSQANTFFNGATISSDFIICTKGDNQKQSSTLKSVVETIETIKQNSVGFVNAMELLTSFEIEDGKGFLFIYFKELKKE